MASAISTFTYTIAMPKGPSGDPHPRPDRPHIPSRAKYSRRGDSRTLILVGGGGSVRYLTKMNLSEDILSRGTFAHVREDEGGSLGI